MTLITFSNYSIAIIFVLQAEQFQREKVIVNTNNGKDDLLVSKLKKLIFSYTFLKFFGLNFNIMLYKIVIIQFIQDDDKFRFV